MTRWILILWFGLGSCHQKQDIEERKLAAYNKMEEKVKTVMMQLEIDCDSTIAKMARLRADSILNQNIKRGKRK
jgi:hypothetical protein